MILVNGAASDTLPATDRGLAYGDGVFRTLRFRAGRPLAWVQQFRKLHTDCGALGIPCPADALLQEELCRVAGEEPDGVGKIIVTRGSGQRGYAAAAAVEATRIVMSLPFPVERAAAGRAGIRARICALRLGIQPALAGIKHLNRLENVLARREWDGPEIAEGILLDRDGNVIGGTMTNLFMVENGALVTPELVRCGVAGVTRERIIGHAAASGMACRPEDVTTERLLAADELFVTNSIIGVWQIRELGDRAWKTGAVTQRIKRWLDEESD